MTRHISLSRSWPALGGAPVIQVVSSDIFTRPVSMCTPSCWHLCCYNGAPVEVETVTKILALGDELVPYSRVPKEGWFISQETSDDSMGGVWSGVWTRTAKDKQGCVFCMPDGACGLHRYCLDHHLLIYALKPRVCVLYPLVMWRRVKKGGLLEGNPEHHGGILPCWKPGSFTLFRLGKEDLRYYFGNDFVHELEIIERTLISK